MGDREARKTQAPVANGSRPDELGAGLQLGAPLRVDVITIFPELFERFAEASFVGIARERGALELRVHDLRRWTSDRHRTVDDAPYGGGPGMVMKPEPLVAAIEELAGPKGPDRAARVALMTPQGRRLDQAGLEAMVGTPHWVLVCGRYEGVDQRVVELAVDEEISIGDFVLSGGEIPAMVVVEGLVRLLPGVLGNPESARTESFRGDLLEGPQYTRPPRFRGLEVPEVLRSGHHGAVDRWRRERAAELTMERRPDLIAGTSTSKPVGADGSGGSRGSREPGRRDVGDTAGARAASSHRSDPGGRGGASVENAENGSDEPGRLDELEKEDSR
ncbi:MAG: tRNA (guanosine(37)-N1)-methyltransferase TrmD [Myxococcota bacterium]